MDTKFRSNDSRKTPTEKTVDELKVKSPKIKFNFFLVLVSLVLASLVFTGYLSNYNKTQNPQSASEYLFTDDEIYDEFIRYSKNVNRFFCYFDGYKYETYSYEEKLKRINLTDQQISNHKNMLLQEMISKELKIEEEYKNKIKDEFINLNDNTYDDFQTEPSSETDEKIRNYTISQTMYEEKNNKILELKKAYYLRMENIKVDVLGQDNLNYLDIKKYLESDSSFKYYLTENENLVATNIKDLGQNENISDFIAHRSVFSVELDSWLFRDTYFGDTSLARSFDSKNLSGFILLPNSTNAITVKNYEDNTENIIQISDIVHGYYASYSNRYVDESVMYITLVLLIIITTLELIIFRRNFLYVFTNGFSKVYKFYLKTPFFIKLLIVFFVFFLFSEINYNSFYDFNYKTAFVSMFSILTLGVLSLTYLVSCIKNYKNILEEPEVKFIRKIFVDLKLVINSKNAFFIFFFMIMYFLLFSSTLIFVILMNFFYDTQPPVFFTYLVFLCIWFVFYKIFINYILLCNSIEKINNGEEIVIHTKKGVFSKPFYNLDNIKNGISFSNNKMTKSERLKTELITNVSHDLKTPLTSIINYVELLKKEGLNSNRASEYLDVLDTKSQRLKYLIEDLFEASKLSSGTATLILEKANIIDLLNQSIGELDEKIKNASIDFKVNTNNKNIYLMLDGKKIWRVFENLINNIINYSPSGSRAYIDIEDRDTTVIMTFKNMSNYELNTDINELFERFKRGDSSRTTEGNGLGLSIAQNIILLHEGEMQIVIDGDLFKVVIVFRK